MKPAISKRTLHLLGSAAAMAAMAFVVVRFHSYWSELDLARLTPALWGSLAGLACVYGMANLLLATAWQNLLLHLGVRAPRLWSIRIYGISQLAKYVPGNVFHVAGRQALGMAAGVAGKVLAYSTVFELALLAGSGALYAFLALPLIFTEIPPLLGLAAMALAVTTSLLTLRRFFGPETSAALLRQMLFLGISASVFIVILGTIAPSHHWEPSVLAGIGGTYVIAWLGGLVTPGSPAGIGVREFILLIFLRGLVPEADLLLAVLLGRMVTLAGDVLFFGAASLVDATEVPVKRA